MPLGMNLLIPEVNSSRKLDHKSSIDRSQTVECMTESTYLHCSLVSFASSSFFLPVAYKLTKTGTLRNRDGDGNEDSKKQ